MSNEPYVIKQIEHALVDNPNGISREMADYISGAISDYRHAIEANNGCIHPWEQIGINGNGEHFCAKCLVNLTKQPPWKDSSTAQPEANKPSTAELKHLVNIAGGLLQYEKDSLIAALERLQEAERLLDSNTIYIRGYDEFGEPSGCIHKGINLRVAIQEAIAKEGAKP